MAQDFSKLSTEELKTKFKNHKNISILIGVIMILIPVVFLFLGTLQEEWTSAGIPVLALTSALLALVSTNKKVKEELERREG